MNWGQLLTDFRKTSGKSQREFAEMLGIPQTTWSGYESGKFPPPTKVLLSLAEKGYIIKGLTSDLREDIIAEGRISRKELEEREEIARFLAEYASPDTAIDDDWAKIVNGVYEWFKSPNGRLIKDLEKIIFKNIATQIKVSDIESRLSALEKRIKDDPAPEAEYPAESDSKAGFTVDPEPGYDEQIETVVFHEGIAAGPPIDPSDDSSMVVDVPLRLIKTRPEDYYALRVQGNSMIDALIPDGSMVLIRKADVPQDGKIQVVLVDGRGTLKRMREKENHNWTICFEDGTRRTIPLGDENLVRGDFVAVLPPNTRPRMRGE